MHSQSRDSEKKPLKSGGCLFLRNLFREIFLKYLLFSKGKFVKHGSDILAIKKTDKSHEELVNLCTVLRNCENRFKVPSTEMACSF